MRFLGRYVFALSLITLGCGESQTSQVSEVVQFDYNNAVTALIVDRISAGSEAYRLAFSSPKGYRKIIICSGTPNLTCNENTVGAIKANPVPGSFRDREFFLISDASLTLQDGKQLTVVAKNNTETIQTKMQFKQVNPGSTSDSVNVNTNTTVAGASGGTGGKTGNYEDTVAGVKFKVWTPNQSVLAMGPTQVFMYLHGDTAGDYHNDSFAKTRDYVLKKGLIFVAVLAPDQNSWWRSKETSVVAGISGVFENLIQKYNIYKDQNIVQGVSGGSTGQTMYFYPRGGAKYVKASFLHCGGAPGGSLKSWNPTLDERSRIKFFVNYGENDYLADPNGTYGNVIGGTITSLKSKNLEVKVTVIPGAGHCKFNHFPHIEKELPGLLVRQSSTI